MSAKNSVDNSSKKVNNLENEILRRLNDEVLNQISDEDDIEKLRDLVSRPEHEELAKMIKIYDIRSNGVNSKSVRTLIARNNLKGAVQNATGIRKAFNSGRVLREVEASLQRKNKGREKSRLYETLQRRLNAGRIENSAGRLDTQSYGEYEKMYRHKEVKKILDELLTEEQSHSEKQGGFSIDEKVSAALANDPTFETLIENLGGKIVDGKLVADAKTKAKIESQLDNNGKVKYSIAWHGTPHDFDSFNLQAIGTGEGAQVHGWGLYFAGDRKVSEEYRERLSHAPVREVVGTINGRRLEGKEFSNGIFDWTLFSPSGRKMKLGLFSTKATALNELVRTEGNVEEAIKNLRNYATDEPMKFLKKNTINLPITFKKPGTLFKVDIPDADVMLDEQKTFAEQSSKVRKALQNFVDEKFEKAKTEDEEQLAEDFQNNLLHSSTSGKDIYYYLSERLGSGKAASLALNDAGVKGITYVGGRDGRCYVVFDDQAIKILEKYSLHGAGNTSISNFVDNDKLNPQQKLIYEFSKLMGMTTQFFRNDNADFHGAHNNGVTYLNVNSKMPLGQVFWHEALHWLKANNPKLFNELAKAANLTQEQLTNYLDTTGRKDLKDNAEVTEEILADAMQEVLSRVKDKNLLQKIVAWIQDTLSKFKEMFRNPTGGLTTAQYNRIANAFANMAESLKDEDGNKIFKFNAKTKQLELVSGEKLQNFVDSEENLIDNSDKIFERYLNSGIMKMVRDTVSKEIGEHIDLSKMNDPVERDKARDKLPYIRQMLVHYNDKTILNNEKYKNRLATKIEYARRCFDNDRRIRNETVRQMDRDSQQRRIFENRQTTFSRNDTRGNVGTVRRIESGVSRNVSGEIDDAYKHFKKLQEENQHSVKGAFSLDNSTVAKNLGGRLENGEWKFADEKSRRAFERHLQNVENNFDSAKHSIANSAKNFVNDKAEELKNKLGLKGENIITDAMQEYELDKQREKAMQDYLDDPSDANKQRLKDLKISNARLKAFKEGRDYDLDVGAFEGYFSSPHKIAAKNPVFNYFYKLANKAMDVLVKKRDTFAKRLDAVWELTADKKSRQDLTDLLIFGDMNQIEYGVLTDAEKNSLPKQNFNQAYTQAQIEKIISETGVSENVARAYLQVRKILRAVREQLDKARRKPRKHSRYLTDKEIDNLKNNKFAFDIKVTKDVKNGKTLVNYTEFANREVSYQKITQAALDAMTADKAIQILKQKEVGEVNGEKIFNAKVREGIAELNNLTGYFPHCFYEYMIRVKDADGNVVKDYGEGGVIGSGRTQREAVKFAQEWQKIFRLKDGEQIYIAPKTMDFSKLGMKEEDYAPIMGDKDFDAMTRNIAKNNELKLKDAKELVKGSVSFKNRHRFFGHFQQRKGAKGYSTDIQWVLRHYTNSAARYIALETEFKPQAISAFERIFGRFDDDYRNNDAAQFCKEYIEDINGNPTHLERQLDKTLAKWSFYRNWLVPAFGERAALTLATRTVDLTSKLTLGMGNISSALLNLTQLINAGGYLGGYRGLGKKFNQLFQNRGKLSRKELKILSESGVLSDFGLDTATGYDKSRYFASASNEEGLLGAVENLFNKASWLLDKGMYPFKSVDKMCRIATTLAAFEKAETEGKSRDEAIEFASEINRKANFDYGANDAPNIFRRTSVIGKFLLQFQKFPIKQLEVMYDMTFSKKTTRMQKMMFWLPYFAMLGLMGLIPAFDWLDKLIYEHTDFSPKDWTQKKIMSVAGDSEAKKAVGKFLMYGGGSLLNIDTSQRAGLANIVPQSFTDFAMGATGSKIYGFVSNMIKGYAGTEEGAYMNALRNVSPGLYNIYAAVEGESFGSRGRRTSIYENLYDRIIRGIGFKSVDESMSSDIQRITSHDRQILTKEKQKAVDAYISNPNAENLKRLKELEIKPKTVKDERERKKLDKLGRIDFGESKKERQQNQYLFDFAK